MYIAENLFNKPNWQVEQTAKQARNAHEGVTTIYMFSDGSWIEQNKISGARQVFLPNGWNVTAELVKHS